MTLKLQVQHSHHDKDGGAGYSLPSDPALRRPLSAVITFREFLELVEEDWKRNTYDPQLGIMTRKTHLDEALGWWKKAMVLVKAGNLGRGQ